MRSQVPPARPPVQPHLGPSPHTTSLQLTSPGLIQLVFGKGKPWSMDGACVELDSVYKGPVCPPATLVVACHLGEGDGGQALMSTYTSSALPPGDCLAKVLPRLSLKVIPI